MGIVEHHHDNSLFLPAKEKELVLTDPMVQFPRSKDTLLVLSGGMDSTTMLYEYRSRIALAVTFITAQTTTKEKPTAPDGTAKGSASNTS